MPSLRAHHPPSHVFRQLFDAELGYVCRSLRRLGVAERDVEDQAQEVFVRAHARLGDLDLEGPTRPWLFAFAVRVASNYRQLRRHRWEVLPESGALEAASRLDPERQAAESQTRARVLAALEALPLERRAVFVLHDIDQTTAPAIAKALEIPVNTVYSRLRKARQEFRAAFEALGEEARDHA